MNDLVLVAAAADFAARQHVSQRRKGRAAEPYINHLAEVASLLAEATGGSDAALVAAGWLHDTVEDTDATRETIADKFGEDVAALVSEVTDDKSLAKEERKRLQIETAPTKSPRARMIKLADKISNLRSLMKSPPEAWERERLTAYVDWAEKVTDGCSGVCSDLERKMAVTVAQARSRL